MARIDRQYNKLLSEIISDGYTYFTDNRDIPCVQISDYHFKISLSEFPLLTTKRMFYKGIISELLWFLKGSSNVSELHKDNCHIWDKDALNWYKKLEPEHKDLSLEEFVGFVERGIPDAGEVGRNYGVQWRSWQGYSSNLVLDIKSIPDTGFEPAKWVELMKHQAITFVPLQEGTVEPITNSVDQIQDLIDGLLQPNPITRRHIVTAWNPAEIKQTALPPCHWAFEIIVRPLDFDERYELLVDHAEKQGMKVEDFDLTTFENLGLPIYGFDLKWHQRSVDTFLGLPYNIASYAVLAHIIGDITNLAPRSIIGDLSNVHLYKPHIELAQEQMERHTGFHSPDLEFSENYQQALILLKKKEITFNTFLEGISTEDIKFANYSSHPTIKGDMYEPKE